MCGARSRVWPRRIRRFGLEGKAILGISSCASPTRRAPTRDVRRRASRDEVASRRHRTRCADTLINHRLVTATGGHRRGGARGTAAGMAAAARLAGGGPRRSPAASPARRRRRGVAADNRDDAGLYRGVRLQAARDWAASHAGRRQPGRGASFSPPPRRPRNAPSDRAAYRATAALARRRARSADSWWPSWPAFCSPCSGRRPASRRTSPAPVRCRRRQAGWRPWPEPSLTTSAISPCFSALRATESQQSDETAGGLQAAVVQTQPGLDRIIRYRSATLGAHLDHAGRRLAVPGQDGTVTIYDVASGRVVHTLTWPRPREFAAFSADDRFVAAGGFDGQVAIWDTITGRQSGRPLLVGGNRASAVFDPTDATRMFAVTDTGQLTTWDRHDPEHPRQSRSPQYFAGGRAAIVLRTSQSAEMVG